MEAKFWILHVYSLLITEFHEVFALGVYFDQCYHDGNIFACPEYPQLVSLIEQLVVKVLKQAMKVATLTYIV